MTESARELRGKRQDVRKYIEETKNFKHLEKLIRQSRKALANGSVKRRIGQSPEDVRAEIDVYVAERDVADRNRFMSLIDARVRYVENNLRRGKDIPFHIFCVSNIQYNGLVCPGSLRGLPQLEASATGIPELRAYALGLPAQDIWHNLHSYVHYRLTTLVKSLDIFTNSLPVREKAKLRAVVQKPHGALTPLVSGLMGDLVSTVDTEIRQPLQSQAAGLMGDATKIVDRWNTSLHHASIRAFARKSGKHQSRIVPAQSWNEDLMKLTYDVLDAGWSRMRSRKDELSTTFTGKLGTLLNEVTEAIESQDDAVRFSMETIKDLVKGHAHGINDACREFRESYSKEDANIYMDATQDRHTSFFVQAMFPAYDQSRADSGPGVTARWYERFTAFVGRTEKKSPFNISTRRLCRALTKNTSTCIGQLTMTVTKNLEDLKEEFISMFEKEPDSTEAPLRAEINVWLDEANALLAQSVAKLETIQSEVQREREVAVKQESEESSTMRDVEPTRIKEEIIIDD